MSRGRGRRGRDRGRRSRVRGVGLRLGLRLGFRVRVRVMVIGRRGRVRRDRVGGSRSWGRVSTHRCAYPVLLFTGILVSTYTTRTSTAFR